MPGHENPDRIEDYASPEALYVLYQKAVDWLGRNVPVVEDVPGAALQTRVFVPAAQYENLPLSNGFPRREFTIPGEIIRSLLPEVAERLKVGDEIQLEHQIPHFRQEIPGQYYFSQERCSFYIAKQSEAIITETLLIEPKLDEEDDVQWESDRLTDTRLSPPVAEGEIDPIEIMARIADGYSIARKLGYNRMTVREHEALITIVDHLDLIRAAKPIGRPPQS